MKNFAIFMGPAGAGKTSLAASFGKWIIKHQDLKVSFINLDPGVEELPYIPQIDVREYVNVRDVMRRYGLGPNGALIKSIDMLLQYKDLIKEKIGKMDADYIMVDTVLALRYFHCF